MLTLKKRGISCNGRNPNDHSGDLETEDRPPPPSATPMDLIRNPNIRKKFFILAFDWVANAVVYNGLSYNTTNLGVSDYLAFFIGTTSLNSIIYFANYCKFNTDRYFGAQNFMIRFVIRIKLTNYIDEIINLSTSCFLQKYEMTRNLVVRLSLPTHLQHNAMRCMARVTWNKHFHQRVNLFRAHRAIDRSYSANIRIIKNIFTPDSNIIIAITLEYISIQKKLFKSNRR